MFRRKNMVRLMITLSEKEAEALARWARSQLREPRDQIRILLQKELVRRELIQDDRRLINPIPHSTAEAN
jgi:hypothetical protein